jgi:hypothetical protein
MKIDRVDRQRRALTLRQSGASLDEIARTLGYRHRSSAYRLIERALAETLAEGVAALRGLELERLDRMQLGLWPKASSGDVKAVGAVLKIMQRRAKLLGLDAPTKIHHGGEIDVRRVAEDLAVELGLPFEEVLAEAEQIMREHQGRDDRRRR